MKHYVQATANQPQQSGGNNTTLSAKTSTGLKAEIGPGAGDTGSGNSWNLINTLCAYNKICIKYSLVDFF